MQQQRDCTKPKTLMEQRAGGFSSAQGMSQRIIDAERGESAAHQALRVLQRKEAAWEAELGAAQTSNAQLHIQVKGLPCRHENEKCRLGLWSDVRLAVLAGFQLCIVRD